MRIFFDTEFTGLHQNTTLISIGLVAENERKFYAEFTDYNRDHVDPWLQENVVDKLILPDDQTGLIKPAKGENAVSIRGNTSLIARRLCDWLFSFEEPLRMWSDCLAYDWVLFLNLWGGAGGEPKCVYYIPFDICTLFEMCNLDPDINREDFAYDGREVETKKHNALSDAITIKTCYSILESIRFEKENLRKRSEIPSRSITEAAKKVSVFYESLLDNQIPKDLAQKLTEQFSSMFLHSEGAFRAGTDGLE